MDDNAGGTAAYLQHSNAGVQKISKNPESISKF